MTQDKAIASQILALKREINELIISEDGLDKEELNDLSNRLDEIIVKQQINF